MLQGSTLKWNASGTVADGNVNCPFAFTDSTAAPFHSENIAGDAILVTYHATVCDIAFSGDYLMKRK